MMTCLLTADPKCSYYDKVTWSTFTVKSVSGLSINSSEPTAGQGKCENNLYFMHACLSLVRPKCPLWHHWGTMTFFVFSTSQQKHICKENHQWAEWSPYTHKNWPTRKQYSSDIREHQQQENHKTAPGLHITFTLCTPILWEGNLMDLVSPVREVNHTSCIIEAAWFPHIKE